jgi:chromosome segregation ATPase
MPPSVVRGRSAPGMVCGGSVSLKVTNRLEISSAEVGELRVRLQIAKRTQNILEVRCRKLAEDLKRERQRVKQLEQDCREAQEELGRLTAELEESWQDVQQRHSELKQSRGSSVGDGPEDKRAEGKPGC